MQSDHLSVTFAALADPTRRAILARLSQGEASVTELAKPFDLSLPGISKHLKVLQRSGLITQSRNAQWRPCRLRARPLNWTLRKMDKSSTQRRFSNIWEAVFWLAVPR